MYGDMLQQNRSRERVNEFLDQFIDRHDWWAARAAWVSDAGMMVDSWRLNPRAPGGLGDLLDQPLPITALDPGEGRFREPQFVPVTDVKCTVDVADIFRGEGVESLIVVDVSGVLDFDVRLIFAAPPEEPAVGGAIDSLRTGAALLPTLIRHEVELDVLRVGALRDPLTGLLNRSGLDELSARIDDGEGIRAIIYIDLDGFKQVNDAHGHAAGDDVLVETAQRLMRLVRPTDLVARVGGDEFVIVATSVLDEAAAVSLAQRLAAALSYDRVVANGAVASVAASGGVVIWSAGATLDETIAAADALMYEAKRIGGGVAMQDATGRILVRDPYDSDAAPEEVERGRKPVRAQIIDDLVQHATWGVHLVLRGELCTVAVDQIIDVIDEALIPLAFDGSPGRLVLEPRGRGWSREGLLHQVVVQLAERHSSSELLVLVDGQPSSTDLRLVVDELRARLGVRMVLGGIGTSSGGDLRMLAQTSPDLLALDREAVLNLERTRPPGVAATLAAAIASALGASLLVLDPPASIGADTLASWGCALVARSAAPLKPDERHS